MRGILFFAAAVALAQQKPAAMPVDWKNAVEEKNFYLLASIQRDPAIHKAVRDQPALAQIAAERIVTLNRAVSTCKTEVECYAIALKWPEPDPAGEALAQALAASPEFVGKLRESGLYVRYNGFTGSELIKHAWADAVAGMNHAIDVYGRGVAPRYPAIDSATYDVKTDSGARIVAYLAAVLDDDKSGLDLFFSPTLRFALGLMDLNLRDEAGRLEPLEKGENAAALRKIKSIDWTQFPYSAIVVPGSGNDRPGVHISPYSQLRVQLAARRYREGKAPLIVVSGGFVHPSQTPYAEAVEMKRELMQKYAIPEEAILIDPHARHTTTNIRNAARILYRDGVPFEKTVLITTDPSQSASIENPEFEKRCLRELGYMPHFLVQRTSAFDLEVMLKIESLHGDPMDPLDP